MGRTGRKTTRRSEALEATTAPGRLRELARNGCAREVAGNPNTPVDLLLKLAARHFDAFLANPVLPLLLLEDPGLFLKLSSASMRRLLRQEKLPDDLLASLVRHQDSEVRESAAWHVSSKEQPGPVVDPVLRSLGTWKVEARRLPEFLDLELVPFWLSEPLAGAADAALRDSVVSAMERSTDPEAVKVGRLYRRAGAAMPKPSRPSKPDLNLTAEEMRRLAASGPWARAIAARHPNTPPESLAQLARDPSVAVRNHALRHPFTPADALWNGSASVLPSLRGAVARNRAAPEAILARLAGDTDAGVRRAVAMHPYLEPAALRVLAADADATIRKRVARHRLTPAEMLEKLAGDADVEVRRAAASNPSLPSSMFARLAEDADTDVRENMAKRCDLSDELLARLACDAEGHVHHYAAFNRSNPRDLTWELMHVPKGDAEAIRRAIARGKRRPLKRKPFQPKPRQYRFSFPARYWKEPRDPHHSDKHKLALSRETSPEILRQLAGEHDEWVAHALAGNHSTPPDVLRELARKRLPRRSLIALNPSLPVDVMEELATDRNSEIRSYVAHNPAAPEELLRKLARDLDSKVRCYVASSVRAPVDVLLSLCDDADLSIQKALFRNSKLPWSAVGRWLAEAETSVEWRKILTHRTDLPPEWRVRLSHDPEVAVRLDFARNPSHRREEFEVLSKDPESSVRQALAQCLQSWSAESLEEIARSDDPVQLAAIAHAINLPATLAERLAAHPDPKVRVAIARNRNASEAALARLVDDTSPEVRTALRSHPRCPPEAVDRWLENGDYKPDDIFAVLNCPGIREPHYRKLLSIGGEKARRAVILNERTPLAIVEELYSSGDLKGLEHLAKARRLPDVMYEAIIADEKAAAVRHYTAVSYFTPREIVERIALTGALTSFYDRKTRVTLAQRPEARPEFLIQLLERQLTEPKQQYSRWSRFADREDGDVLRALVARLEIPVEKFAPLLNEERPVIRRALIARPDLPPQWRQRLKTSALHRAINLRTSWTRLVALCHPETASQSLWLLGQTGRWLERLAVARNPAAPRELLALLAMDSNRIVRAEAKARLEMSQRSKS